MKKNRKNEVVAIVVTYNRWALLKECVNALLNSERHKDILVIDNCSTDETGLLFSDTFGKNDNVFYYRTKKNSGGAGGFFAGLKIAYKMGYEYFWLMDDDTIVHQDSLSELIKADNALKGEYGFLSSLAFFTDGSLCAMNYHQVSKDDWNKNKYWCREGCAPIKKATFVSFFMRRKVLEEVGLPIKEYFIWGDDTEYSIRISNNYPCFLAFNSAVTHKMKENQSTQKYYEISDKGRIERMYYSFRNNFCTYRRQGMMEFLKINAVLAYSALTVLFKAKDYKLLKLWVVLKGFVGGAFFFPKVRKVTD